MNATQATNLIYRGSVLYIICLFCMGCGNHRPDPGNNAIVPDSSECIQKDSFPKTSANNQISDKDSTAVPPSFQPKGVDVHFDGHLIRPNIKVKGIYITGATASTKRMNELIDLVTSTEMNAIVLDIKNDGGNITYNIDFNDAKQYGACIRYVRDMPQLLKNLHEKGVYVIGRIVCFKDPLLAKARPELALCKADGKPVTDGKGLPWVNPFKQEVWEYICGLAEQATLDGFDEIQFDYVRFPIGDDANRAVFGVSLDSCSRECGLNNFFKYMEHRLHKKNIIYGADLFGTVIGSDIDRDRTGQDYVDIAKMTDNICPMVYPSHYGPKTFGIPVPDANPYQTILKAMRLSKEELSKDSLPKAVVRPWLQCFSAPWVSGHIAYGSEQIRQQIQAVYDAGYDEWILWNASNKYGHVKSALTKKKNQNIEEGNQQSDEKEIKEEKNDSIEEIRIDSIH